MHTHITRCTNIGDRSYCNHVYTCTMYNQYHVQITVQYSPYVQFVEQNYIETDAILMHTKWRILYRWNILLLLLKKSAAEISIVIQWYKNKNSDITLPIRPLSSHRNMMRSSFQVHGLMRILLATTTRGSLLVTGVSASEFAMNSVGTSTHVLAPSLM